MWVWGWTYVGPPAREKIGIPPYPHPSIWVRVSVGGWYKEEKNQPLYMYIQLYVLYTIYIITNTDTGSCINMHKYINVSNCKPCNHCNYYIPINYSDNLNFRNS